MRKVALAIVLTLAGCSAPTMQPGNFTMPAAAHDPAGTPFRAASIHPNRERSWMLAPANTGCAYDEVLPPCGLLYLSEFSQDDVLVFQHDTVVGTLTGFNGPDGVCSDKSGNVWISNNRGASVVEYAHGGTKPIATLKDPGVYPLGCSVNPITGSVAVANFSTTASGRGSIAIYHHATGKPLILTDPDIYYMYFCGYDSAGNLYVDGLNTSGAFQFAELPRNKYKFTSITLDTTVYFPGNVQWDGKHVDVGDQMYQNSVASAVYRTDGAGGQVVGTTVLSDSQDVVGYWIQATNLIGPDANLNDVGLYRYPIGGKATLRVGRLHEPYGAAVSYPR